MRHRLLLPLAVLLLAPSLAFGQSVGDWFWFKDDDFDTGQTLDLVMSSGQQALCFTVDHNDVIDVYTWDGTVEAGPLISYTGSRVESFATVAYPGLPVSDTERYRIKPGTGAASNKYVRVHCRREK